MKQDQKILLTSANGRTGRRVLKALSRHGAKVRVFIREENQFEALKALGAVDYVAGDLTDPATIRKAVKGVSKVFHIGPPMHPKEVEISQTLIDAAKSEQIEHFIYYSVMHPHRQEVRHHKLKLKCEEYLIESGLPYTILQPSRYMQHLVTIWDDVMSSGVHAMAFSVDKKFSVVDLEDLSEASAIVATQDGHKFAMYELAGPQALSQTDMAAIISDVTGKPIVAKTVRLDDMERKARDKGFGDDKINQMRIMNAHYDTHGFVGNSNVLKMILKKPPTRFIDLVKRLNE